MTNLPGYTYRPRRRKINWFNLTAALITAFLCVSVLIPFLKLIPFFAR